MKTYKTDADLRAIRPKKGAKVYRITKDGLYYRVYPSNLRAFGQMLKSDKGHNQFVRFASHGDDASESRDAMTFAQAHTKLLSLKIDAMTMTPQPTANPAQLVAVPNADSNKSQTLRVACDYYLKYQIDNDAGTLAETKRRTRQVITDHFLNQTIPDAQIKWGDLPCDQFRGSHFAHLYAATLMEVQNRRAKGGDRQGKCTLGDRCDKLTQPFFTHLVKRRLIDYADRPERLKKVNKSRAVRRSLSVAEIENLYKATTPDALATNKHMNHYDAAFLRLLLTTGLRCNSLRLGKRSMRNRDVTGFFTFPSDDLKETQSQKEAPDDMLIPITPLFEQELARLDDVSGDQDFLFLTRWSEGQDNPNPRSTSWAKHLAQEHKVALKNTSANHWTAHATRRTMGNNLREQGFSKQVVDQCQARVPSGTAATYYTAKIIDQVQNAFERWHLFLYACMQGKGDAYMQDVRDKRMQQFRTENAERMQRLQLEPLKHATR